jgi:ParB-like chromosome segregation protein Spo0J
MNPQRVEKQTPGAAYPGKTRLQAVAPEPSAQQSLFAAPAVASSDAGDEAAGRLAMRSTDTLKPHPSLLKLNLWPTQERLLALEKLGEAIFEQPLLITRENLIVDGYARWRIARSQQRATLLCIECPLTEQEALQRILQTSCRPDWLNDFCRVRLALELEPWFRAQGQANQSAGGKQKGSSKLTEDLRVDCRKQIATLAGVSTGNVTKMKQILRSDVVPELIEALRSGEISIHLAWTLSKLPTRKQEAALGCQRFNKRRGERLRKLLARHVPKCNPIADSLRHLSLGLSGLKNTPCLATHWKLFDESITAIEHEFPTGRSESNVRQTDHQEDTGRQLAPLGQCADEACGH